MEVLRPHCHAGRSTCRRLALLACLAVSTLAAGPAQARSRRQLPPDVILHPDRGIGISRFSKASHDQRLFKSINNGTRLPGYDPAIDPYNNVLSQGSTYDIQTGQVRGSLSDHYAEIRREEENARRQRQERARQLKAADASNSLATTKSLSAGTPEARSSTLPPSASPP